MKSRVPNDFLGASPSKHTLCTYYLPYKKFGAFIKKWTIINCWGLGAALVGYSKG